MSKINSIVDLIEAGIRSENLRQKTIADNFANLETPGYRRVDVEFKELLDACSDSPEKVDFSEVEPQTYEPRHVRIHPRKLTSARLSLRRTSPGKRQ
ncbi:MAG: flagellar basal body rod protein FlgB [Planctomycetota bacterium]|jgi:flagellar basal-body rod protein FlgB